VSVEWPDCRRVKEVASLCGQPSVQVFCRQRIEITVFAPLIKRIMLSGIIVAGFSHQAVAQVTAKPPSSYNKQEQEAVEVVKGWLSAWRA